MAVEQQDLVVDFERLKVAGKVHLSCSAESTAYRASYLRGDADCVSSLRMHH
ncbi:MAG: hypothetical protein ACOC4Z_01825 [Patescibacteria group bacterium]